AQAVLVLSHGLGEHARRYDHVIERLTALGLAVYAVDHRGHGRSGGKRVHLDQWSDFTEDLQTLFTIVAQEYPARKQFLLGHSMGGAVALSYALDHQQDLAGLMLSGPAVVVHQGIPAPVLAVGKFLGKYFPRVPVQSLDATAVSRDPAVVMAYKVDPLVHHGKIPAAIASAMIKASEGFPDRLPSLTVPVLLQHGTADRLTNVAGSQLIADLASSEDLTLKTYQGLFHEIFNEPEQEQVLTDLVEWLQPRI
ncbi:MAG: lysophospholipase, partial [Mycobacteriaceae bacterium]